MNTVDIRNLIEDKMEQAAEWVEDARSVPYMEAADIALAAFNDVLEDLAEEFDRCSAASGHIYWSQAAKKVRAIKQ